MLANPINGKPLLGKRERDLRNGLTFLRITHSHNFILVLTTIL